MVHELLRSIGSGVALLILIAFTIAIQSGQVQDINSEYVNRLILSIYLDKAGNSLVSGYTENPAGLIFLNSSQYSYDNNTSQLYAMTNALTRKEGDSWTLEFESLGSYEDYHLTFILPNDFMVKNISSTQGLNYQISISNDSIALDFQGYDIRNPATIIEYEQPLEVGAVQASSTSRFLLLLLIFVIGFAIGILLLGRSKPGRELSARPAETEKAAQFREDDKQDDIVHPPSKEENLMLAGTTLPDASSDKISSEEAEAVQMIAHDQIAPLEDYEYSESEYEDEDEDGKTKEPEIQPSSSSAVEIEISNEMAAVMETLLPRERAVLQVLIERGGRASQADLRYETRMPKSTLTSIIYSLERRKLITKKEWGRTNMIELSNRFLSKKNGS
ncbi:MAG: hypothetical protein LUQ47_02560 [Methanotrichaceae archaeon]|nr:hypothetical protein [Methanotrichaceae archaeon]